MHGYIYGIVCLDHWPIRTRQGIYFVPALIGIFTDAVRTALICDAKYPTPEPKLITPKPMSAAEFAAKEEEQRVIMQDLQRAEARAKQ